jgi:SAM-dependent methyltransferase
VEQYVIPWTLEGLDIGPEVVEIGPGYGAVTAVLQNRVEQLTCVEIDTRLADRLRRRSLNHNVKVLCEDATAMSLPNASFDGALCFTMLHHIPSTSLQNRLLMEVHRILKPNGIFAGTDSIDSRYFGLLHLVDTCGLSIRKHSLIGSAPPDFRMYRLMSIHMHFDSARESPR